MNKVSLPGGAWVALITLLTGALSGWLQAWLTEPWVPLVVLALGLLAKAAEIYLTPPATINLMAMPERSKLARLLLG